MPQQPPSTTEGTVQFLRLLHGALLVSVVLYGLILWRVPAQNSRPLDASMLVALGALSVVMIAVGVAVRAKFIREAFETLRIRPDDAGSLAHWRKGDIVSAALAEAVVLYGVAIHFIGGSTRQVAPFFVVGAIVMLLWWPQRP